MAACASAGWLTPPVMQEGGGGDDGSPRPPPHTGTRGLAPPPLPPSRPPLRLAIAGRAPGDGRQQRHSLPRAKVAGRGGSRAGTAQGRALGSSSRSSPHPPTCPCNSCPAGLPSGPSGLMVAPHGPRSITFGTRTWSPAILTRGTACWAWTSPPSCRRGWRTDASLPGWCTASCSNTSASGRQTSRPTGSRLSFSRAITTSAPPCHGSDPSSRGRGGTGRRVFVSQGSFRPPQVLRCQTRGQDLCREGPASGGSHRVGLTARALLQVGGGADGRAPCGRQHARTERHG